MPHPCADHIDTCDHCALCESGVCCAGLATDQRAQLLDLIQAERLSAQLQQAVTAEAARTVSFADLMRIETERQALGAPLDGDAWSLPVREGGALPAPPPDPTPARKEAAYVRVVAHEAARR